MKGLLLHHRLSIRFLSLVGGLNFLHWGWGGTIQIGIWSLIVTALYVWRRDLPACMVMHLLNDAYAFILLPGLFAQYLP